MFFSNFTPTQVCKNQRYIADWSKILMNQHEQLRYEIDSIRNLLKHESYCIHQLAAKIKRLTQGVQIHLALEHTFLNPALDKVEVSEIRIRQLTDGFTLLDLACNQATSLINTLLLSPHDEIRKLKYEDRVNRLLSLISVQILEEDGFYFSMRGVAGAFYEN